MATKNIKRFLRHGWFFLLLFFTVFLVSLICYWWENRQYLISQPTVQSTPEASPTPSPTPRPLTFAEANKLYGPCWVLPTLMYHHVQDPELARTKNQSNLTVATSTFANQMQELVNKGYTFASPLDLTAFFDIGTPLPKKTVLLTFDDGYEDFYTNVYPILRQKGLKATVFLPTGLIGGPDYLNWGMVKEMADSGLVYFGNHTWSHKNVANSKSVVENEISLGDTQLAERNLNVGKVFAYPYGNDNAMAINYLSGLGYQLAFTTKPGTFACKQKRLDLPRIRIGGGNISAYGL